MEKIALYGFNNLTKTCSFNIYDVCYASSEDERQAYLAYIDEQYNSDRLTQILIGVTELIGAHVLNIAKQDYDPQGASVTMLISEEPINELLLDPSCNIAKGEPKIIQASSVVAHLDTSHVTVHTYPEYHPNNAISTFRVDIDVSTCGKISPLNALDFLIGQFDSDIITIDYRVRGFTREVNGGKLFIDHGISSIQNFINEQTIQAYHCIDVNMFGSNLFHTKMMLKNLILENYMFTTDPNSLPQAEKDTILNALSLEMSEIYNGQNVINKRSTE